MIRFKYKHSLKQKANCGIFSVQTATNTRNIAGPIQLFQNFLEFPIQFAPPSISLNFITNSVFVIGTPIILLYPFASIKY